MTTSERIRKAALGPLPSDPHEQRRLMAWVGDGEPWSAVWHLLPNGVGSWSSGLNNDERRMFLLFVAEAVK